MLLNLRVNQNNTRTHDVGFMVYNSFGKGLELGDLNQYEKDDYVKVVLNTAHSLATRFSPTVGCTKSWDGLNVCRDDKNVTTNFPVIMDNMMNLELLLWAGRCLFLWRFA